MTGMITAIKDLLAETIERRCPGMTVVRSKQAMEREFMARKLPLAALITNPGRFDDREVKIFRYYDPDVQTWKQQYIRGNRRVPVLLYCWANGEEETDRLFSRIIPAIPRQWQYNGFDGLILIEGE